MLTVCAYCPTLRNVTAVVITEGPRDGHLSHGICAECLVLLNRQLDHVEQLRASA